MESRPEVVAQLSGGLDSAVALALARREKLECRALFFSYGQPYEARERAASRVVAKTFCAEWREVGLPRQPRSGDYFPLRNLVMAAVSAAEAQHVGARWIYVGSKSAAVRTGDAWSYADSTHGFFEKMNAAIAEAWDSRTTKGEAARSVMPLCGWSRTMTLTAGEYLGVPRTWSCYAAGQKPCGECHRCQEDVVAKYESKKKKSVLLVGQAPAPGGAGRERAFEGALSGQRLERWIGCQPGELLRYVDTANVGSDHGEAAARADALVARHLLGLWHDTVVLLGARARAAFGVNTAGETGRIGLGNKTVLWLPHPSGLCRWWNDPENIRAAVTMMRSLVPTRRLW